MTDEPLDIRPPAEALVAAYDSRLAIVCAELRAARTAIDALGGGEPRPHGSFAGWRGWLPEGGEAMLFAASEGDDTACAPAVYAATLQARRLCPRAEALLYVGAATAIPERVGGRVAPTAAPPAAWIVASGWLNVPRCVHTSESPPETNPDFREVAMSGADSPAPAEPPVPVCDIMRWEQPTCAEGDASIAVATAPRALDTPLDWRWAHTHLALAKPKMAAVDRGAAAFAAALRAPLPPSSPAAIPPGYGLVTLGEPFGHIPSPASHASPEASARRALAGFFRHFARH